MEDRTAQCETFDVVVVGGGINGTAIARSAAVQGLSVLLLERNDVGSATSAWNSRLIHGGLKYLENFEIRLVRESLRDREWLLRSAPHLVQPIAMAVPFLKRNKRGRGILTLGMFAYDFLSYDKSVPNHRTLSRQGVIDMAPGIDQAQVSGASVYYDAQVESAERLSVENMLSALEHGAQIRLHTSAEELLTEAGKVVGVRFADLLSGQPSTVRARCVVNAAGPWVDRVFGATNTSRDRLIGGTSGTHFIVDVFPGAPSKALYYEAKTDARPLLIIPWKGKLLIGSTDQRYEDDPGDAVATTRETDYILREINDLFPDAHLSERSVLYSYTGVRPLPFEPGKPESKVTRSHKVVDHAPTYDGFLSVVGGKLTTFPSLGDDVVAEVTKKLGRKSSKRAARAAGFPGARAGDFQAFRTEFIETSGLSRDSSERLLSIYGTRSAALLQLVVDDPALALPIWSGHPAITAEVIFTARTELARTIDDIFSRRMMLSFDDALGPDAVDKVGETLSVWEGWSPERVARDIEQAKSQARRFRPQVLGGV